MVAEVTPKEIKENVKFSMISKIENGEKSFKLWFGDASFAKKTVTFNNKFLANQAKKKFSNILRDVYGFMPRIVVRYKNEKVITPNKQRDMSVTALPEKPKVIHIKKAHIPKTGFSAKEMVILNLPHSEPKEKVWVRENGSLALVVQGGYLKGPNKKAEYMGIPYGTKARLILFWLMSEAIITKSRRIYLGDSFNSFLQAVGVSRNRGGKESGRQAVLKQLYSILHASFMLQYTHEDDEKGGKIGVPARFTGNYELWTTKGDKRQTALFSSFIDLSQEFFDSLKKNPVPLDWDIIIKIGSGRKASSLALDLYAWLSFESAKAQHYGKGRFVPWKVLWQQMGSEYTVLYDFSKAARATVKKINKFYNTLKVTFPRGGIRIADDSLPSVARSLLETDKDLC